MVDNLKSAVLRRLIGEDPVFNPRYLDFSRQAGFTIKPCNVRKGNEKGRVESGVGYVKKNLLNGLEIPDFSALNPAARVWLDTIANVRIHGETHKRPVIKTLESFQWTWPRKINRLQVQNLFRLKFVEDKANVIVLGGVGLGKTHLATALGYAACLKGYSVLFVTAVDVINTLAAAQNAGRLKQELNKYLKPALIVLDEIGYLPIDKTGADLLFQIISKRYEQGSIILTSNRVFKKWPEIFNNDATLTSALLDRLLHHAETVLIEGKSYRMKDQIES
jgi:DNA replication protein DnaC